MRMAMQIWLRRLLYTVWYPMMTILSVWLPPFEMMVGASGRGRVSWRIPKASIMSEVKATRLTNGLFHCRMLNKESMYNPESFMLPQCYIMAILR